MPFRLDRFCRSAIIPRAPAFHAATTDVLARISGQAEMMGEAVVKVRFMGTARADLHRKMKAGGFCVSDIHALAFGRMQDAPQLVAVTAWVTASRNGVFTDYFDFATDRPLKREALEQFFENEETA